MKNKKGFTLVELLAIIVILAVIMVIAVPQILNVVNGSKNGAWKNNVSMIERGIVKNANLLNPETGAYDYSIDKICSNPSLLSKVVKVEDTNITCSGNVFTLTGTGQFTGKSATISCNDKKCTSSINQASSEIVTLKNIILANNTLLSNPTLTDFSTRCEYRNTGSSVESYCVETDQPGLYSMSVTNGFGGTDGVTYYFRGMVTNNYVSFAGLTWRIVRINEDGTVRLALNNSIKTMDSYKFNDKETGEEDGVDYLYYSNSMIKTDLEAWYNGTIVGKYNEQVATGNYFCEEMRVTHNSELTSGNATATIYGNYISNLSCHIDGNGKGLFQAKIGLMSYDEMVLVGSYPIEWDDDHHYGKVYFNQEDREWLMTPAGLTEDDDARIWTYSGSWGNAGAYSGMLIDSGCYDGWNFRPVINLKADVTATGTGTESDPYVITD